MEIKDILRNLRENNHLTQDQMAERAMVVGVDRKSVTMVG